MIGRVALAGSLAAVLAATGTVASVAATTSTSRAADIAAVRHATAPFANLQRAENAGYELLTDAKGIACIDMPGAGGMGVHFANGPLVADPAEHLRRPEVLVYRIDKTGMLRLAAVEYVVLVQAWHAEHPHTRPVLFGHRFMLTKAGNRYGLPAFYSLHAWVWYRNPAGGFAPFNPRVRC